MLAGLRLATRCVASGVTEVSGACGAAGAGRPVDIVQVGTQCKAVNRAIMLDVMHLEPNEKADESPSSPGNRRRGPSATRAPQHVINDLPRRGVEEARHAGATHGGQRVGRQQHDELHGLVDHLSSLDRRQRRRHARRSALGDELGSEARVLERRLLRRIPQPSRGELGPQGNRGRDDAVAWPWGSMHEQRAKWGGHHGRGAHRLRHDRRRAPLEERPESLKDHALEPVDEAVLQRGEGDLEPRLPLLRGPRLDSQLIVDEAERRWRCVAAANH